MKRHHLIGGSIALLLIVALFVAVSRNSCDEVKQEQVWSEFRSEAQILGRSVVNGDVPIYQAIPRQYFLTRERMARLDSCSCTQKAPSLPSSDSLMLFEGEIHPSCFYVLVTRYTDLAFDRSRTEKEEKELDEVSLMLCKFVYSQDHETACPMGPDGPIDILGMDDAIDAAVDAFDHK